jgi:phospholipid/cholesterol/gamma-HCH transport system substrate-binding protein
MNPSSPEAAEPFKFRHVHAITGTFVLIVIGILIAVIVFAGRSQRWFVGNVTVRILLPEGGAAGIRRGSEVYFLGTLVGTVSDVSVDRAGRMEAQVNIRRDFFLFVRADSSAVVKRKFGIGDAYFEITRGHGKTLPEKNARIVCNEQLPSALEAAVEEVRREAVPALNKLTAGLGVWTTLGSNLVTTRESLDQLLLRVDGLAANLQQGKGTVGRMLVDASAADELQLVLRKAQGLMDELQPTIVNLKDASAQVLLSSTNLPAISDALRGGAQDLPALILQTHSSMREMERLVSAIQEHWLVRKYVDHVNPPRMLPHPEVEEPSPTPQRRIQSPRGAAQ